MKSCRLVGLLTACAVFSAAPAYAQADFGIVPGSLTTTAQNEDSTLDLQASTHPFSYTLAFAMNTDSEGHSEGGEARDILITLPPGLIGNPTAVPQCPRQEFEGGSPRCSAATQIGFVRVRIPSIGVATGPLFNVVPPPGVAAQLGFSATGLNALQNATVDPEAGYAVGLSTDNIPEEVTSVSATVWGVPADPSHDPQRGKALSGESPPVSTDAPLLPFLTLPANCTAPLATTVAVDSKLDPGHFVSESTFSLDSGGNPTALLGCDSVPFSPSIFATPTTPSAGTSNGLDFKLELPNDNLLNPKGTAETEPVRTEVALPEGLTVNPAAASGMGVCSTAQFHAAAADSPGCPENSKLGTLLAKTPLLEEPIEGAVYLATPHANPFGSLIALYIVASAPQRGVVVKQAGEVHVDEATGQITTTFNGLPPVPYSSFELDLREGPTAPLITPATCGRYLTQARLYSFAEPGSATLRSAPFTISSGNGGAPCAASPSQLPNHPSLEAGTLAPLAGAYSPVVFRVFRRDGEQEFGSISATLPKGLAGKLAGIPYCPEPAIAGATARSHEGEGALERVASSCPAASQVGNVDVAAGAGSQPIHVQGRAYLAGPYKGAPLSLVIVTPAIAGPFDLGVVVVRTALYVDERTAQIHAVSDQLPKMLDGIPLDVRTVSLEMDRRQFTLNPTSCVRRSIEGQEVSSLGAVAALAERFQVGGCKGLDFKPKLTLRFKGPTHRRAHPKLIATLKPRPGDANISFAQVRLPKAAFLDNAHIGTICTNVQFAAETCPAGSIYGKAEATTPLLDYALQGTVYLRSSTHQLPDLVVAFKGPPNQPIKFTLAGKTDSVKGALRNTFEYAPDVPVSKFRLELFGGKRGLVELSSGLCRHRNATVRFKGHNGREYEASPTVKASCGKGRAKTSQGLHRGRSPG